MCDSRDSDTVEKQGTTSKYSTVQNSTVRTGISRAHVVMWPRAGQNYPHDVAAQEALGTSDQDHNKTDLEMFYSDFVYTTQPKINFVPIWDTVEG